MERNIIEGVALIEKAVTDLRILRDAITDERQGSELDRVVSELDRAIRIMANRL